jgi:hypothetical protein
MGFASTVEDLLDDFNEREHFFTGGVPGLESLPDDDAAVNEVAADGGRGPADLPVFSVRPTQDPTTGGGK